VLLCIVVKLPVTTKSTTPICNDHEKNNNRATGVLLGQNTRHEGKKCQFLDIHVKHVNSKVPRQLVVATARFGERL
jgi:hypothetical protein